MRVVPFKAARPRSYTSAEDMIARVRERVLTDGRTYTVIAKDTKVSTSTIGNLASGKTRWPRPTTLFPLLVALKMHIELVDD
jgi:hypothetical protein